MQHAIRVERVFNLGEYKSLRIVAETTEITDEDWENPEALANIRSDLQSEVMASFALHMLTLEQVNSKIAQKDWQSMYEEYA